MHYTKQKENCYKAPSLPLGFDPEQKRKPVYSGEIQAAFILGIKNNGIITQFRSSPSLFWGRSQKKDLLIFGTGNRASSDGTLFSVTRKMVHIYYRIDSAKKQEEKLKPLSV